jgi:choline monooxygenase
MFDHDPDLARASTLPAQLYLDPEVLEVERERIFARTWQLVGSAARVAEPGRYACAEVAGEPIVVVRDAEELRGFYNVCLHRAGPVARGCGQRQSLQCGYHGWTYSLSGALVKTPEMEGVEGFRPAEMHLRPVRVASFGPLVFANLDPGAPSLEESLDEIPQRAASLRLGDMRYVMAKDYVLDCNWKVYVDNYLEGYHLPIVHPQLFKELDYEAYRVEPRRTWSIQHAPLRPVKGSSERHYVPTRAGEEAQYYWIFPNLMLNAYKGQLQTNLILPLGPERTLTRFEWYALEPPADPQKDDAWRALVEFSDVIQAEDIGICQEVQRNLRSRAYAQGRYSVKRENGLHHFHQLLRQHLVRVP